MISYFQLLELLQMYHFQMYRLQLLALYGTSQMNQMEKF